MSEKKLPWVDDLLQGMAFWLGHQGCYYRHYHASEGALSLEACHLLNAKINQEQHLFCEVMYRDIVTGKTVRKWGQERVDLLIADVTAKGRESVTPKSVCYVLEVKRYQSSMAGIYEDMRRLYDYLMTSTGGQRAFLLLVSEKKRPLEFVNADGCAVDHYGSIPECRGHFKVRRVCKASASFKCDAEKRADYACLIEVLQTTPRNGIKKYV